MAAVAAAAIWRGKPVAASRVFAAALFLVVLFDPWAVLAPGFWLSFGAVAIIFFVVTGRIGRIPGLRQWGIVQWAITLGLSPLLLALFHQVSLVSPVANAIAIPLVGWVVTPLALAGMIPPLGFLLNAADSAMTVGMAVLRFLSGLPIAVWQPHAPPVWAIAAALAGVFWLLLPRGFPARWLGLTGMLPLFLAPPRPAPGELWVTVLDVGQGLAVVARSHGHALLFDAGPRYGGGADSGNRVIMPFLRASGISRLDGVVISHNDEDHLGGAASVLDAEPVGWIASSLSDRHPLLARPIPHWRCQAGERWAWDGVRFAFLSPAPASYGRPASDNARSCVLKISAAGGNILLAADIPRRIEAGLAAHDRIALRSTVLVAPHHGSKFSSSRAFVRQVMPAVVVFSNGYRNRFGHPAPQIVARYRAVGSRPYRTDQDGAIILRFGRAGVEAVAQRRRQRRYWR
ncbi:MAG TPA: DNA internalization-related competence protein ComEC/Rec2, partial [Betaproteobacteria bacterium]|nr:DNA internalization-related competence protein ComEC/Rec2 [Betaproteobacteria bacterium]